MIVIMRALRFFIMIVWGLIMHFIYLLLFIMSTQCIVRCLLRLFR